MHMIVPFRVRLEWHWDARHRATQSMLQPYSNIDVWWESLNIYLARIH